MFAYRRCHAKKGADESIFVNNAGVGSQLNLLTNVYRRTFIVDSHYYHRIRRFVFSFSVALFLFQQIGNSFAVAVLVDRCVI
jgi:hypothetical protein